MADPKTRVVRLALKGATFGLFLGVWLGAWIAAAAAIARKGLFLAHLLPDYTVHLAVVDLSPGLESVWNMLYLPLPTKPLPLLLVLAAVGTVFGASLGAANVFGRLDPHHLSLHSMAWSARSLLRWPNWLVLFCSGLIPLAVLYSPYFGDLTGILLISSMILISLLMQIVLCRVHVVAGPYAHSWWTGRLPRLVPTLAFFSLLALDCAVSAIPDLLGSLHRGLWLAAMSLMFVASVPLLALQTGILLRGSLPPNAPAARWKWPRLGPWWAMTLVHFLLVFMVLAPVLALFLLMWKAVPALAALLESTGQSFPALWRFLIQGVNFLHRYWLLLFGIPLGTFCWLAAGRLAWLQDFARSQEEP